MFSVLILSTTLLYAGGTPGGCPSLRITPPIIQAGAFYNGAHVKIEGAVPSGSQAIVTVTGSDHEERYNRKARFGPVWIGAGTVHISGAPSLFLRFSTLPVAAILSGHGIAEEHLDEDSVTALLRIQPALRDSSDGAAIRANYVALKKSSGTYSFGDGGVVLSAAADGCTPFTLQFEWPKQAPPATYQVRLYGIRDHSVQRTTDAVIPVVRAGFPAWLAGLAESRAPLYGMIAVLIGALAGFGIDFLATHIFGKKRLAAH